MIAKVFAVAAAGISVVSATCAYPPPLANQLPGNSVTRPDVNDPATIGQPFDIIWDATGLSSSVSLILLRGPSTNIQYLETIVSGAPNTGTYSWTPESSLEPDTTHYGIMLQDDATCLFQWSTQFGLNPGSGSSSSSVPPTSSTTATSASKTGSQPPASPTTTASSKGSSDQPPPPPKTWSTGYGGSWGSNSTSTSTYWLPAGTGAPTASGTYKPLPSNDAGRFGMSFVGAAAALAAALMLL